MADKLAAGIEAFDQTVLVLQGGGALGAYQVGVFEALAEAGVRPDWLIGTSIGAINSALIAGNAPENRQDRLDDFWSRIALDSPLTGFGPAGMVTQTMQTILGGVSGFFRPNPLAFAAPGVALGADHAGYYSTDPLRETLSELIDPDRLATGTPRLTVGAASVTDSEMHYFDSDHTDVTVDHVVASGALPPAFPPVRIDGELYWDGGILSNTPLEYILDANPERPTLIFAVQLWNPDGPEPESIMDVMNRHKDIQYASRSDSHIERHRLIHRLRHVIAELAEHVPDDIADRSEVQDMLCEGCLSQMHVVRLMAPTLEGETYLKDLDFSATGIERRRAAGYRDAMASLRQAPWQRNNDPRDGLVVHDVCNGECLPPRAEAARAERETT